MKTSILNTVKSEAVKYIQSEHVFFDEFFSFDSSADQVIVDIKSAESISVSLLEDMFIDCIWSDVVYNKTTWQPCVEDINLVKWERGCDIDNRAVVLFVILSSGVIPSVLKPLTN